MRLEPYRRPVPSQPVGLVTSRRRVLLEDSSTPRLRDAPVGLKLYADAHLVNMRFLRRGDGWCHSWNDRPVRWFPDLEHEVILLQGYPGEGPEIMDGLVAWRDALHAFGARIGSPASASVSLLKATLRAPLYLGGDRPKLSQVLGGRQQAFVPPGTYGAFVHLDMSAAYARTLGALVYPGAWWRPYAGDVFNPEVPVMARAVVTIPGDLVAGPLPVRPRRKPPPGLARYWQEIDYPVGRRVQGVYAADELRAARDAGCRVKVLEAWMMLGPPVRPFARWWSCVQSLRALPGYAGELGKMVGNTLHGRFALEGTKTLDRFEDGRRVASRVIRGAPLNPAYGAEDVFELVAAHVRARLYSELIVPYAGRVLSVHTDGGLVKPPADVQRADWRVKDRGAMLVYLGPQMYARHDGHALTYTVSGFSPDMAGGAFRELARRTFGWPPTAFGEPLKVRERRRLERLCAALGAEVPGAA